MKGIVNEDFKFISVIENEIKKGLSTFEDEDVFGFNEGDEIEILKTIESDNFLSRIAYVVYDSKTAESITIDSAFVTLIAE
ncbi:hypothetical protein [Bacillus sp. FJAT-22090]|uniref:hypothetical protein n=1 Tax=Bacillus sp. FJAT-22090 TaxID=1581038 RepID=UPI0011A4A072|nr:hypothetical protein [Bacillus sp. FJAT-22090]